MSLHKEQDIAFKSMTMIEDAFSRKFSSFHTLDWKVPLPANCRPENVIIMGSFFERIMQPYYWPDGDYSLYALCSKSKRALSSIFCLPGDAVGLVSRYELFPIKKPLKPLSLNPKTTLFYAGRISPQKNIEFLVFTTFYLQMSFSKDIQLQLFGNFDNEYHKHIQGCHYVDYQRKISALIDSLPWCGLKPVLVHALLPHEWIRHVPDNAISMTASTLISEDFSVVSAQIQQEGIPLIAPHWGSFSDLRGTNVLLYPPALLASSHSTLNEIGNKAKTFVRLLLEKSPSFTPPPSTPTLSVSPSKKISRDDITRNLQLVALKYGTYVSVLEENNLPQFVKTSSGQKIFADLIRVFSDEY